MTSIPINITHRSLYIPHSGYARCRNTEIAQKDAEQGSESLRIAMRQSFGHFALKHGISLSDAKLLLMNGEGL